MKFPVFIEMEQKKVLVFGCGAIGLRRIRALCEYGAKVRVVALHIPEEVQALGAAGTEKFAEREDIQDAELVLACTNDRELNHRIGEWCHEAGIIVNVADCKEESDFYFPGLAREGNLVAGICADGLDHKKVRLASEAVRGLFRHGFAEEQKEILVGSRESLLSVAQTNLVLDRLREIYPERSFRMKTMKTTGDKILDRSLDEFGGKGLFVKELDLALEQGRVDLTVHSLKDMPMEQPEGYPVLGMFRREDPRDVLVYPREIPDPESFSEKLKTGRGLVIGTSSSRRKLQLGKLFPEASFKLLRGNVITRLRKLDEGEYDVIVLAAAGLKRLGLENRISRYLEPGEVLPAAGQGILAIQGRSGEDHSWLRPIRDKKAEAEGMAERAFIRELDGGCKSPSAALANAAEDGLLELSGLYYDEEKQEMRTGSISGKWENAQELGVRLAVRLRDGIEV